eukprot:8812992-Pyramimonas_sp.AAC.1
MALDLPAEVADRVVALVPCLTKLVEGVRPEHAEVLRRNVALHSTAPGVTISVASSKDLRFAQHGPRLGAPREASLLSGARVTGAGDVFQWNVHAEVFVPADAASCVVPDVTVDLCDVAHVRDDPAGDTEAAVPQADVVQGKPSEGDVDA